MNKCEDQVNTDHELLRGGCHCQTCSERGGSSNVQWTQTTSFRMEMLASVNPWTAHLSASHIHSTWLVCQPHPFHMTCLPATSIQHVLSASHIHSTWLICQPHPFHMTCLPATSIPHDFPATTCHQRSTSWDFKLLLGFPNLLLILFSSVSSIQHIHKTPPTTPAADDNVSQVEEPDLSDHLRQQTATISPRQSLHVDSLMLMSDQNCPTSVSQARKEEYSDYRGPFWFESTTGLQTTLTIMVIPLLTWSRSYGTCGVCEAITATP